jgi:hypothetical protein
MKDILPTISPIHDMIKGTCCLNTNTACHPRS